MSVSNRSLNKNRHKRRRYRTLNTGNISDESITFDVNLPSHFKIFSFIISFNYFN